MLRIKLKLYTFEPEIITEERKSFPLSIQNHKLQHQNIYDRKLIRARVDIWRQLREVVRKKFPNSRFYPWKSTYEYIRIQHTYQADFSIFFKLQTSNLVTARAGLYCDVNISIVRSYYYGEARRKGGDSADSYPINTNQSHYGQNVTVQKYTFQKFELLFNFLVNAPVLVFVRFKESNIQSLPWRL